MSNFDGMTPSEQDAWHEGRRKGFRSGVWSSLTIGLPLFALCFAVMAFAITADVARHTDSDYSSVTKWDSPGQSDWNFHYDNTVNPGTVFSFKHCNKQYKKHHRYFGVCKAMQPVPNPQNPPPPRAGGYNGGSQHQPADPGGF